MAVHEYIEADVCAGMIGASASVAIFVACMMNNAVVVRVVAC